MRGFRFTRKKKTKDTGAEGQPRSNKYNAHKVTFDGMTFDSGSEGKRYLILKDAQSRGIISNLRCQVEYELLPNMYKQVVKHLKTKDKIVDRLVQRKVVYTADFVYDKGEETIVEDIKPNKILQSRDFGLRKKMMYYFHRIVVREVYDPTEPI